MGGEYTQLVSMAQRLEQFARNPPSGAQVQRVKETQRRFRAECRTLIDRALAQEPERSMVRGLINRDINNLIHHNPAHEAMLIKLRGTLLAVLDGEDPGEGRKRRRKTANGPQQRGSMVPYLALMLVLTCIFLGAMYLFGPKPMTASVTTRDGLVERARAFERIAQYDRYHRSGDGVMAMVVNTALSPFEPTEEERLGAAAFEHAALAQYRGLRSGRDICGARVSGAEQTAMLHSVAHYLTQGEVDWQSPAARTLRTPMKALQPCS